MGIKIKMRVEFKEGPQWSHLVFFSQRPFDPIRPVFKAGFHMLRIIDVERIARYAQRRLVAKEIGRVALAFGNSPELFQAFQFNQSRQSALTLFWPDVIFIRGDRARDILDLLGDCRGLHKGLLLPRFCPE